MYNIILSLYFVNKEIGFHVKPQGPEQTVCPEYISLWYK